MITKMLTAIVMTGALWVAGDAAAQKISLPKSGCDSGGCPICAFIHSMVDCCSTSSECCDPPSDCCYGVKSATPTTTPTGSQSSKPVSGCCTK